MVNRIKPAYRRDAARFLQLVLYESNKIYALDLCRLYFIDMERVYEDQPLIYHRVDMSTLVRGCHHLRTRLLSHTLGLLDLTPLGDLQWIGFRNDDSGKILHTRVHIFHRTVKDFLLHNTAARSFINTSGLCEEHIRLSIARGLMNHMIMVRLLWGCDGLPDRHFALKLYDQLQEAMQHISCVENSLGAAQSKLMRSLYTYCFELRDPTYQALPIPRSYPGEQRGSLNLYRDFPRSCDPYRWCKRRGQQGVAVDLIGMAASSGMVRYVCEILDLPIAELQTHPEHLSECKSSYSIEEALVTRLSWVNPEWYKMDYSHYRQLLSQYLKWEPQVLSMDQTRRPLNCKTLAETYLLARCCADTFENTASISLITILLRAGANPMVRIESAEDTTRKVLISSAWERWLFYLSWFSKYCLVGNGFHDSSTLDDYRHPLDDLFIATKAFLAQGAHVNYQTV